MKLLFAPILLAVILAGSVETLSVADQAETPSPRVPVRFEPNLGQAEPGVRFLARGAKYSAMFLADGSVCYFYEAGDKSQEYTLRVEFPGSEQDIDLTADGRLPSVTNVYEGRDPSGWVSGIPNYARLRARSVYPNIELIWRSRGGDLEQVFVVEPGGDPGRIRVRYPEATSASLDETGAIQLGTTMGKLRIHPPYAYQTVRGRRRRIEVSYRLDGKTVSFVVGDFDRNRRLIIDPTLGVSTYLGGAGYDRAYAVAMDSAGNMYAAGETASFKLSSSVATVRTSRDLFVSKVAADGTTLVYTTILGSTANDSARAIALDSSANAYVAGVSSGANFPVTTGAYQTASGGGDDAVIAKLGSTGTLSWATYAGEGSADIATGIAVDTSGYVYVTGYTASPLFPTTSGAPQTSFGGGTYDAFLLKLNATGTSPVYSTLHGGSGIDISRGVAITSAGVACIAGVSQSSNLTVVSAYQSAYKGGGDAMAACLNAAGTGWVYSTYLGGAGVDEANAIALDSSGNAYVAGTTFSKSFPVTYGSYQTTRRGSYEAFLAKIGATGSTLSYGTYFGGSGSDSATTVALDSSGAPWIGGYTTSVNLPTTSGWQTGLRGGYDGFAAQFSLSGQSLLASSYIGGSAEDRVLSIATSSLKVVVAGVTASKNFPVTTGAQQTKAPALSNGFIATWTATAASPEDPPVTPVAATKIGLFLNGIWYLDTGDFIWSGTPTDRTGSFGATGDVPLVGDWNGDGAAEVAIYRRTIFCIDYNGNIHWNNPPSGDYVLTLGASGDTAVAGDWNGDGKTELGVFRAGAWYLDYNGNFIWDGTSGGDKLYSFGQSGDVPLVGDWTGDGISKIGIFRSGAFWFDMNANGTWDTATGGDRLMTLGSSGYTPVIGDWNGDGRDKGGVFYAGTWSLDYDGDGAWEGPSGGDKSWNLGASGEAPVVGDWSADGKTKIGTFTAGTWKLDYNGSGTWDGSTGGDKLVSFGSADTTPVVGKW